MWTIGKVGDLTWTHPCLMTWCIPGCIVFQINDQNEAGGRTSDAVFMKLHTLGVTTYLFGLMAGRALCEPHRAGLGCQVQITDSSWKSRRIFRQQICLMWDYVYRMADWSKKAVVRQNPGQPTSWQIKELYRKCPSDMMLPKNNKNPAQSWDTELVVTHGSLDEYHV